MARFFWKMIDPDNEFEVQAKDVLQLLNMFNDQYPGVISTNAMKLAKEKLKLGYPENLVKFKDFYALMVKMPTFMYPVFKLQHALQRKFLGQKFWEDKKHMMERARKMIKRMRDSNKDPNMSNVKFGDKTTVYDTHEGKKKKK